MPWYLCRLSSPTSSQLWRCRSESNTLRLSLSLSLLCVSFCVCVSLCVYRLANFFFIRCQTALEVQLKTIRCLSLSFSLSRLLSYCVCTFLCSSNCFFISYRAASELHVCICLYIHKHIQTHCCIYACMYMFVHYLPCGFVKSRHRMQSACAPYILCVFVFVHIYIYLYIYIYIYI
jgi:hypothetical protein